MAKNAANIREEQEDFGPVPNYSLLSELKQREKEANLMLKRRVTCLKVGKINCVLAV